MRSFVFTNTLTFLEWNSREDLRAFTVVLYSDQSVHGMGESNLIGDEDGMDTQCVLNERVRNLKISSQRGVISLETGCNGNPIIMPPVQTKMTCG